MDKQRLGTILIILGILVWPVGLWVLPTFFDIHLEVFPYILVPHLCGVIPGVLLRGSKILKKLGL